MKAIKLEEVKPITENIDFYMDEIVMIERIINTAISQKKYSDIYYNNETFGISINSININIFSYSTEISRPDKSHITINNSYIYDKLKDKVESEYKTFKKQNLNDLILDIFNNNETIKRNIFLTDLMK